MDQIFYDTSRQIDTVLTTFSMYRRDLDVYHVDDDHIWIIPSLLRGSVGICATSKVILIVIVLYFLVPPTGDYTDVITYVNPRKNQCKPWGNNTQQKNKNKIILYFPKVGRPQSNCKVGPSNFSIRKLI